MTRPRVVITGIGGVTPLANDIESTWKKLLAGESGIAPITLFDASAYDSRIADEAGSAHGSLYPVCSGLCQDAA